mmetsp:Transcript_17758/g.37127  ORF Transcript_17758/g.37127 Transcript_17758/m.37127 type:complete len:88 (+) Transcript_17758:1312-1575(+)
MLLLLLFALDRIGSGGIDGDFCREEFMPTSDVDVDLDVDAEACVGIDADADSDADADTDEEDSTSVEDNWDDNGYSFWLSRSSLVLL